MSGRSQAACQTPGCRGMLGFWAAGQFLPAGHLIGGRDLYTLPNGALRIRCSFCNTWHRLIVRPTTPRLVLVVAARDAPGPDVLG